jgi:hypothetical protein
MLLPTDLIFNIDVSAKWGWNYCTPSSTCSCCTDCTDPACITCLSDSGGGENSRSWLMDMCNSIEDNAPNRTNLYEIDWVRVYQLDEDIDDDSTTCNPSDRPTKHYINYNQDLYMLSGTTGTVRALDCVAWVSEWRFFIFILSIRSRRKVTFPLLIETRTHAHTGPRRMFDPWRLQ